MKIEEAPRPEDDSRANWRALITASLPEHEQRDFERHEFVPCYACSSKPGSPSLCRGCLANRQTITELQEQRDAFKRKGAETSELARRAAAQAAHEAASLESRLLGLITSIEKI
jgi:hypothetical protein